MSVSYTNYNQLYLKQQQNEMHFFRERFSFYTKNMLLIVRLWASKRDTTVNMSILTCFYTFTIKLNYVISVIIRYTIFSMMNWILYLVTECKSRIMAWSMQFFPLISCSCQVHWESMWGGKKCTGWGKQCLCHLTAMWNQYIFWNGRKKHHCKLVIDVLK